MSLTAFHSSELAFHGPTPLSSANRNLPSVYTHPQVVHEYIQKELVDGNFIVPLPSPQLCGGQQTIHISRIRVVPKGHNQGWGQALRT